MDLGLLPFALGALIGLILAFTGAGGGQRPRLTVLVSGAAICARRRCSAIGWASAGPASQTNTLTTGFCLGLYRRRCHDGSARKS